MQVEFHPDATDELDSSANWYAKRSAEAARRFLVAIDLAVSSMTSDPDRFVLVDDQHRSCSVAKFPFQLIFRHDEDKLFIVAVAHAKRRPGYWLDRS